jgi:hypothetical protein
LGFRPGFGLRLRLSVNACLGLRVGPCIGLSIRFDDVRLGILPRVWCYVRLGILPRVWCYVRFDCVGLSIGRSVGACFDPRIQL